MQELAVPPRRIARLGSDDHELVAHAHAALWLEVRLEEWGVTRQGHLHLVCSLEQEPLSWRQVELGRCPLASFNGKAPQPALERARASLEPVLAELELCFHAFPDLGVVSELGEDRDSFRRRCNVLLGPELRRRLDDAVQAGDRRELAAGMARLLGEMQSLTVQRPLDAVRRLDFGVLMVPQGLELAAPRHRSMMVEGRPVLSPPSR